MGSNECEHIARYISQIQRKGASFIGKGLAIYDIGFGQFSFLMELYRNDGISQEELSEKLHIDKGTTARAVKKLEDGGFVRRYTDENDKRAYKIFLTEKSLKCKEEVKLVGFEWEKRLTSNLDEDEKKTMIELLKKICINENIR